MRTQESIIGNSPTLTRALEKLSHLAGINRPVLIIGERGTGKELAAQRLHFLSSRWEAPLVKVNCAAMAESLLESELFGHESGAFTGATRTRIGRFERADGGTLFLDELGAMSQRLQEKLLRLVEYGEFERLGGQETLRVDVRVIAATNADLKAMAADNRFRADLLDRLSFDVVHLPPLRHRREDIGELATHFGVQLSAELGRDLFPGFSDSALQSLQSWHWPGNIRELKNTVERSIYHWHEPGSEVGEVILDPFLSPFESQPTGTPAYTPSIDHEAPVPDGESTADFHTRVSQFEQQILRKALADNAHNQRRTATTLGLSYDQIRGLVRKYKLSGN